MEYQNLNNNMNSNLNEQNPTSTQSNQSGASGYNNGNSANYNLPFPINTNPYSQNIGVNGQQEKNTGSITQNYQSDEGENSNVRFNPGQQMGNINHQNYNVGNGQQNSQFQQIQNGNNGNSYPQNGSGQQQQNTVFRPGQQVVSINHNPTNSFPAPPLASHQIYSNNNEDLSKFMNQHPDPNQQQNLQKWKTVSHNCTFNFTPDPNAVSYPYNVISAFYGNANIIGEHINKKMILIMYPKDIPGFFVYNDKDEKIPISKGVKQYDTTFGRQSGYEFYIEELRYWKTLDELFPGWEKNLRIKVEKPELKVRYLLANTQYQGYPCKIVEYSEKSIALLTAANLPDTLYSFDRNNSLKDENNTVMSGYTVMKSKPKILFEIEKVFNVEIVDKFKLSPALVRPQKSYEDSPVFIATEFIDYQGLQYILEQWRYSRNTYAIIFKSSNPCSPPNILNLSNGLSTFRNGNISIQGIFYSGYIVELNNSKEIGYLRDCFPKFKFDDGVSISLDLQNIIPSPGKEATIDSNIISLMALLKQVKDFKKIEKHNKIIYCGTEEKINENLIGNEGEKECEFIFGDKKIICFNGSEKY